MELRQTKYQSQSPSMGFIGFIYTPERDKSLIDEQVHGIDCPIFVPPSNAGVPLNRIMEITRDSPEN